ncbi:MAG: sigma-70 family RNA polymerase sigma factor [Planctomycetes bacterium]|nr:sigma-70 family RNA polymerase sigma factor [Planctomycetota bacterium]
MPTPESRAAPPAPDLAALVARMATGDEAALAELWDATRASLFGLALQVVRERGGAEEALLDTYAQAWREARRFDPARGHPLAWLLNMARSRAIDRLRLAGGAVRRRETALEAATGVESGAAAPVEAAWLAERRARIVAALERLPVEQAQALRCAFFLGMSHSEVADHLEEPLGTVKTRIRTGLQRLRHLLLELEASA